MFLTPFLPHIRDPRGSFILVQSTCHNLPFQFPVLTLHGSQFTGHGPLSRIPFLFRFFRTLSHNGHCVSAFHSISCTLFSLQRRVYTPAHFLRHSNVSRFRRLHHFPKSAIFSIP